MIDNPHGFIHDLDEAEYHAHKGSLSVSGAKVLLKAPALFRWQQDHPVHKDAFDIGSAAHAVVLGKGMESVYVAPFDDWRTATAKAEKKIAQDDGLSPILHDDWAKVCDMAEELSRHKLAMRLLSEGEQEVSAFAVDEPTGVLRRARFDHIADGWIVDYKTTIDAHPEAFASSAAKFGYAMQDAWYTDLARDLGRDIDGFVFIVQSKEPPYLVTVCELDWASQEIGRRRNRAALERYARCVSEDHWPGYPEALHTISLPRWALNEEIPA